MVQPTLFRLSFKTWYRWRNRLLRLFGASVDRTCRFTRTVRIECPWNLTAGANTVAGDAAILYCLGPVVLGERVTISQYAHLCGGTHDYDHPDMPLLRPPIYIADDAWIGADAFVGPGVTVGTRAILGARSSAFSDIPPGKIAVGSPARPIKDRPTPPTNSPPDTIPQ